MLRNFAQPFNTAESFIWHIRVDAFGNGLVDDGGFFFFVEFEQAFFVGYQFVYLGRFAVEVVGNGGLFFWGLEMEQLQIL
ncbi:MAG: hypothetical protein ACOXZK_03180 [Bacteroidales bacterium]